MHRAGGERGNAAFNSSQLFAAGLNARSVYIPERTPSDFHKQMGGGGWPEHPAHCLPSEHKPKF